MKSKKEITNIAKELCPLDNSECAIFISGFLHGWEECLKELEKNGQDREKNN